MVVCVCECYLLDLKAGLEVIVVVFVGIVVLNKKYISFDLTSTTKTIKFN